VFVIGKQERVKEGLRGLLYSPAISSETKGLRTLRQILGLLRSKYDRSVTDDEEVLIERSTQSEYVQSLISSISHAATLQRVDARQP
jgi:hypothetical protein